MRISNFKTIALGIALLAVFAVASGEAKADEVHISGSTAGCFGAGCTPGASATVGSLLYSNSTFSGTTVNGFPRRGADLIMPAPPRAASAPGARDGAPSRAIWMSVENCACAAGLPSPAKPFLPLPATVEMTPEPNRRGYAAAGQPMGNASLLSYGVHDSRLMRRAAFIRSL